MFPSTVISARDLVVDNSHARFFRARLTLSIGLYIAERHHNLFRLIMPFFWKINYKSVSENNCSRIHTINAVKVDMQDINQYR